MQKQCKKQREWDLYFLQLAEQVKTRGSCNRKQVGCVIVSPEHRIVSCGYNGSIPGTDHCDETTHLLSNNSCIRTIHAEQNALLNSIVPKGSTCYVTMEPCVVCFKLLVSSGVTRIVFIDTYKSDNASSAFYTSLLYPRPCTLDKTELGWEYNIDQQS